MRGLRGGDHFQEADKADLGRAVGCRGGEGTADVEQVHLIGLEWQPALGSSLDVFVLTLRYMSDKCDTVEANATQLRECHPMLSFDLARGTTSSDCILPIGSGSRVVGVCLFDGRGELFLSWRRKGHKDEEAVLCVNCDTCPVSQFKRRPGVFYRILSRRRQRSVQRLALRTGETCSLLRVECIRAKRTVITAHRRQ
jgi:hypothetical protein